MNEFFWFLIASGLCLGLLLLPYRIWFRKTPHFRWNRFYLLATLGISLLLPQQAAKLELFPEVWPSFEAVNVSPSTPFVAPPENNLPTLVGEQPLITFPTEQGVQSTAETVPLALDETSSWWIWGQWALLGVYLLGLGIGLIYFVKHLFQLRHLVRSHPQTKHGKLVLVHAPATRSTFSFFRWIFAAPQDLESPHWDSILSHEGAHAQQWHSLDVLLADLSRRTWWFLPWRSYLSTALKETHEYLADQSAVRNQGVASYARILLHQSLKTIKSPLPIHHFAQSKTQKRIHMLHRSSQSSPRPWQYLAALPLLGLTFLLLACLPTPAGDAPVATSDSPTGFSFAGESFPFMAPFDAGLEKQLKSLKENPDFCQKLWYRGQRRAGEIKGMLRNQDVHPDFLYLAMAESSLDPEATSSMGACGVWQFLPATARSYGMVVEGETDERKDLARATLAATQYLHKYHQEFGSWTAAALAYNRGPAPLRDPSMDISDPNSLYRLDHERGYLYRILAIKAMMENPSAYGVNYQSAFGLPFPGEIAITSEYGIRKSPFDHKLKHHDGIDLKASLGTEILAVSDGVISKADRSDTDYGHQVMIQHGGKLSSRYCHMDEIHVKTGEKVKKGQVIGNVGNTGKSKGPHLHLEIREDKLVVNPELYLPF